MLLLPSPSGGGGSPFAAAAAERAADGGGGTVADSAVAVKERGLEAESAELKRKEEDQRRLYSGIDIVARRHG